MLEQINVVKSFSSRWACAGDDRFVRVRPTQSIGRGRLPTVTRFKPATKTIRVEHGNRNSGRSCSGNGVVLGGLFRRRQPNVRAWSTGRRQWAQDARVTCTTKRSTWTTPRKWTASRRRTAASTTTAAETCGRPAPNSENFWYARTTFDPVTGRFVGKSAETSVERSRDRCLRFAAARRGVLRFQFVKRVNCLPKPYYITSVVRNVRFFFFFL